MDDKLQIMKIYELHEEEWPVSAALDEDIARAVFKDSALMNVLAMPKDKEPSRVYVVRFDANGVFCGYDIDEDTNAICVGKKSSDDDTIAFVEIDAGDSYRDEPKVVWAKIGSLNEKHAIRVDLAPPDELFDHYDPFRDCNFTQCDEDCWSHNPECAYCENECKDCEEFDCDGCEHTKPDCCESCDLYLSRETFHREEIRDLEIKLIETFKDLSDSDRMLIARLKSACERELEKTHYPF